MSDESSGCGCGCVGCAGFLIAVLIFWAFAVGLPTPWGTFNLDIFPPAIRQTGGAPSTPPPLAPEATPTPKSYD